MGAQQESEFMSSTFVPQGFQPDTFQPPPGCHPGLSQRPETILLFLLATTLQENPCIRLQGGEGSPNGSPNPGGWGQSCLESRAVLCPAVMCSFEAAFQCLQALPVFGWVSKMWLVSHCHVNSVHRFCVGTAILTGWVCKAVWSWDIFLPEIPTRIYRCTCINTWGNTCGSYFFFLLPS